MNKKIIYLNLLVITPSLICMTCTQRLVDPSKTVVWGPGLKPDAITLPARYFFVHAVDRDGIKFEDSPPLAYTIIIRGTSPLGKCRYVMDEIDRGDGSTVIRYKIIEMCQKIEIDIKYNGSHVADSPYQVKGIVYSEKCYCPQDLSTWLSNYDCSKINIDQITTDLQPFKQVNFSAIRENLLKRYNMPGSISLCNYVVKNNEIYRKCYGKYTGFKMFMDDTLSSLTRLVSLPDMEFFLNLGDYPLSKKGGQQRTSGPYPILSWCGSDDSYDIVLPTYDITESTIENMGRIMLDMLSVQRAQYAWENKEEKAFWRGRDSRRERLKLIDIAREYPDLINASITNFFFYREEVDKYGPKVAHISLLDFFKYKYQINIDGSVAAYRLPYLLGGNSLVFKQDSPYYEHFYKHLIPNKHFIPIKRDLSDLISKITWAKSNDQRAKEIVQAARNFVEENLLPIHIYCYHVRLFEKWSKRIVSPIMILPDMEKFEQDKKCSCLSQNVDANSIKKDEL